MRWRSWRTGAIYHTPGQGLPTRKVALMLWFIERQGRDLDFAHGLGPSILGLALHGGRIVAQPDNVVRTASMDLLVLRSNSVEVHCPTFRKTP
jgi:hypothetical protein